MRPGSIPLRQRDGVSCGPSVAIVGGALLDPGYAPELEGPEWAGWFANEQGRVHRTVNRVWPRALGTTPTAIAKALSGHSARRGVRYRWRVARGGRDRLVDIREAVLVGWPVAMLIGRVIPRHWVLLVGYTDGAFSCYEPSSGQVVPVSAADIRGNRLARLGFARPFAFVLPARLSAREPITPRRYRRDSPGRSTPRPPHR